MQVKVSYPTDTEAVIAVVADPHALQAIKEHVLGHFAKNVKVAGFRQGKAPAALIEKQVDQTQLQTQFLEEAVEQLYFQAVSSEKLRVVSRPEIKLSKFVPFTTLEFEAKVPVVRTVKLPDYTKIRLNRTPVTVTAKDVSQILENLRSRAAEREEVKRGAQEKDEVIIDFLGVDAKTKQPINGADGKDYPLVLGSDAFIPGFESNLIGLTAGEEKTFVLTFPPDYAVKALASKKVSFTVTVKKVSQLKQPKLDDVFAASVGPFSSLQALKDDIKKQLTVERQQEADRDYEGRLVKQIVDKSEASIPKALLEEQLDRLEQEERQNLLYRGQTWEEHLKEESVTAEEHRQQKKPAAEERLKASLVLAEIAEQEHLSVTPEELEIRIQLLKGQYQDEAMRSELDKPENRRDIEARLLTEKTLDKLINYATK